MGRGPFSLQEQRDGLFSIQSMYFILINNPARNHDILLWKLKLLLDFFLKKLWYLVRGVTLTKVSLVKRRWKGSLKCTF
jgi:hypothetical protein